MDSNPEMIFVRPATFHDTLALGLLIQEALPLSPSSVLNEGTVLQEAFLTGSEVLEGAMVGTEDLLIAEVDEEVAGLVLVKPKELVRSRHVARLQLVVHPEAPGQEVRVALLRAALERSAERALIKVVMDVAQPDRELQSLVEQDELWWTERLRRGAVYWNGARIDVTTWACWVKGPPGSGETHAPGRS